MSNYPFLINHVGVLPGSCLTDPLSLIFTEFCANSVLSAHPMYRYFPSGHLCKTTAPFLQCSIIHV